MNKFYIDAKDRKIYAYKYENDQITYLALNRKETENLLNRLTKNNVREVKRIGASLEAVFTDRISITLEGFRVLYPRKDRYDRYYRKIMNKIKDFKDKERMKKYKETLPSNHKPKVNRSKKVKLPSKQILAGVLSATITASLIAGIINKESSKEEKLESPSISYTTLKEEEKTIPYKLETSVVDYSENSQDLDLVQEETNTVKVKLAFDDKTDDGKLANTIENCRQYLDPWIERYGLPKDLTYALVCQESGGVLDLSINSGGACGPMQLQVAAFHNENAIEYIKVPIYENGELTGEYDEFYVADARHLDDTRLAGKDYLVMQDLEDNFRIGCAIFRRCIDRYKNIFVAIDAYNKGLYCLPSYCSEEQIEYYQNNFNDFSWVNIIPNAKGNNYGDPNYIWNVLRYLDTGTRGDANIEYYYQDNLISIDLMNTNVYNNELSR